MLLADMNFYTFLALVNNNTSCSKYDEQTMQDITNFEKVNDHPSSKVTLLRSTDGADIKYEENRVDGQFHNLDIRQTVRSGDTFLS
jgi:hypothetical protein